MKAYAGWFLCLFLLGSTTATGQTGSTNAKDSAASGTFSALTGRIYTYCFTREASTRYYTAVFPVNFSGVDVNGSPDAKIFTQQFQAFLLNKYGIDRHKLRGMNCANGLNEQQAQEGLAKDSDKYKNVGSPAVMTDWRWDGKTNTPAP